MVYRSASTSVETLRFLLQTHARVSSGGTQVPPRMRCNRGCESWKLPQALGPTASRHTQYELFE